MTTALEGSDGSASRLGRSLPSGKTRYPLYRGLGGPQGRSGQVRKISPPPEFDPRTVQPVASRYTDYATRPTSGSNVTCNFCQGLVALTPLNVESSRCYFTCLTYVLCYSMSYMPPHPPIVFDFQIILTRRPLTARFNIIYI